MSGLDLINKVKDSQLVRNDEPLILGVSGGVDSVCLAHVLAKHFDAKLHLAHVNYGLRGKDSDADQELCKELALHLGVEFHLHAVTELKPESGVQEWARRIRYSYFADLARELSISLLAVAHHSNDQVETVLHNLFRGTGIRGLAGMKASRQINEELKLIRPLLSCSRSEIEEYAQTNQLSWREDLSNSDLDYNRSWLRKVVIPMLESRYGTGLSSRIFSSTKSLKEIETWMIEPGLQEFDQYVDRAAYGEIRIPIQHLRDCNPALRKMLLLRYMSEVDSRISPQSDYAVRLEALVEQETGKTLELGKFLAARERDSIVMYQRNSSDGEDALTTDRLTIGEDLDLGEKLLKLRLLKLENAELGQDQDVEHADLAKIKLPLQVRQWRWGDRFQPRHKKEAVVVLSENKIIWIPGCGISESCKLDSNTESVIQLGLYPKSLS